MSDLVSAAAAALGIPESLTQRSAEARAAETGASLDEILSAWAGGAPPPATTQEPSPAATAPEEDEAAADPEPVTTAPVIDIPVPDTPQPEAPIPVGRYKPPVLVGVKDNPVGVLVGAIGLFAVIALIGLVGPASLADEPGARTSAISYSETALEGRDIYLSLGCAACHTQMVRPVVADVGLGDVTLNDSNQVLGTRRFGPDLANVGARLTSGQLEAIVGGLGTHPAHSLSPQDLSALVEYLSRSQSDGN
ncbi:MAG: cbb3-type cytochrome c oxidase subunit II [Acidimicrobiia bacterium]|nr:cbb3-type cytochrome c oxidase subunit II [Acidimicrobiia bacterium]